MQRSVKLNVGFDRKDDLVQMGRLNLDPVISLLYPASISIGR